MVDGRTSEQGYTISSPCEQKSSCEVTIGGKDPPKLIERTLGRNDQVRNDQGPKRPVHICTTIMPIVSQSESENSLKNREINYNFMAKNKDQFSFFHFCKPYTLKYKLITFRRNSLFVGVSRLIKSI